MKQRDRLFIGSCHSLALGVLLCSSARAQFTDPILSPISGTSEQVLFGDLDGDGDLDAVSREPNSLMVYKNDGAWSLTPFGTAYASGFVRIEEAGIADADGDGDLDLLLRGYTTTAVWDGLIYLLLNDGSGVFSAPRFIGYNSLAEWRQIALGHVDSNGELDLASYRLDNDLVYVFMDFESTGTLGFYTLPVGPGGSVQSIQIADLDGDGDGDILMTRLWTNTVQWFTNLGAPGSFSGPFALPDPVGILPTATDVADLDGDGDLEVIILGADGPHAYENLGGGNFAPSLPLVSGVTASGTGEFSANDLDADGDRDLIFVDNLQPVWSQNDGTGTFSAPQSLGNGLLGFERLVVLDSGGDGDGDVLASNLNQIAVSENLLFPGYGDVCTDAAMLVHGQAAGFNTALGAPSALSWQCVSGSKDFWFAYTMPFESAAFRVDLEGDIDSLIEVYEGPCEGPTLVACDAGFGSYSVTVGSAVPGQTYLLRVGKSTGTDGAGRIRVLDLGGDPPACWTNQDFESGDLSGWIAQDIAGAYLPFGVTGTGTNPGFGLFSTDPTSGSYAFHTGFDGSGPGVIKLSQFVVVTPEMSPLSFNYRAGWTILNPMAVLDRTFSFVVRDGIAGTVLQSELILTAAAQTTQFDTGNRVVNIDLSAFVGQFVELGFEWFVPEDNTGPAHFQLDNLSCPGVVGPRVGLNYCGSLPNSTGMSGVLRMAGESQASLNNLTATASQLPSNVFGFFLSSPMSGMVSMPGGSQGNLCLGGALGRHNRIYEVRNTDASGTMSLVMDLTDMPTPLGPISLMAGESRNFQAWYRDTNPTSTSNFTDAVTVQFD